VFPPLIQTAVAADAALRMFYLDHQPPVTQLVTRSLYIDIYALRLELRLSNYVRCIHRVRKKEPILCIALNNFRCVFISFRTDHPGSTSN